MAGDGRRGEKMDVPVDGVGVVGGKCQGPEKLLVGGHGFPADLWERLISKGGQAALNAPNLASADADLDAVVYAHHLVLPDAEAYEHVGVATTPGQLSRQWQRFGLPDVPPTIDMPADAGDVMISMSGTPEPPPATPDPVSTSITEIDLIADPRSTPFGSDVTASIGNRTEFDRVATGQRLVLDHWTGHHFETLGVITGGDAVIEVGPGETTPLMTVNTGDPEFPTSDPGWFRLTAQLDVTTGDFGRIHARGHLHLTASATEAPTTASAITAGPPCAPDSSCSAALLIDGRSYELSCGLIDPTLITTQPLNCSSAWTSSKRSTNVMTEAGS